MGRLYVTFIDKEGDEHKIAVSKGNNLLEIAQAHDIEMEGRSNTSDKRLEEMLTRIKGLAKDPAHAQRAMS